MQFQWSLILLKTQDRKVKQLFSAGKQEKAVMKLLWASDPNYLITLWGRKKPLDNQNEGYLMKPRVTTQLKLGWQAQFTYLLCINDNGYYM